MPARKTRPSFSFNISNDVFTVLQLVADDVPLLHGHHPPGQHIDDLPVMGDQNDRRAQFIDLLEQGYHIVAVDQIEVPGRLIGKDDAGPVDERTGDGEALFLAARELVREVRRLLGQSHDIQDLGHVIGDAALRSADHFEREGDVLERGAIGEELEILENGADLPAQERDVVARDGSQVDAVDEDQSIGRRLLAGQQTQERGLAGACRPDDGNELAILDGEVDLVEGNEIIFVDRGNVSELYHEVMNLLRSPSSTLSGCEDFTPVRWSFTIWYGWRT